MCEDPDNKMGNTRTEWNDLACFRLPTLFDPVFGIEILPEGIETVNVTVMQVENGIKACKDCYRRRITKSEIRITCIFVHRLRLVSISASRKATIGRIPSIHYPQYRDEPYYEIPRGMLGKRLGLRRICIMM